MGHTTELFVTPQPSPMTPHLPSIYCVMLQVQPTVSRTLKTVILTAQCTILLCTFVAIYLSSLYVTAACSSASSLLPHLSALSSLWHAHQPHRRPPLPCGGLVGLPFLMVGLSASPSSWWAVSLPFLAVRLSASPSSRCACRPHLPRGTLVGLPFLAARLSASPSSWCACRPCLRCRVLVGTMGSNSTIGVGVSSEEYESA